MISPFLCRHTKFHGNAHGRHCMTCSVLIVPTKTIDNEVFFSRLLQNGRLKICGMKRGLVKLILNLKVIDFDAKHSTKFFWQPFALFLGCMSRHVAFYRINFHDKVGAITINLGFALRQHFYHVIFLWCGHSSENNLITFNKGFSSSFPSLSFSVSLKGDRFQFLSN